MLDTLARLNQKQFEETADPETQARIAQYEMAFRMQTSVPELVDLSKEPDKILEMYGPDVRKPGTFASCCLLARRLAERGVRFTQIFHRGWDQHFDVAGDLPNQCRDVDQACYALITDLKARGMTLKRVLKAAVKDLLPEEIITRPKRGFGVPLDRWFREDLKAYVDGTLGAEDARVKEHLAPAAVDRILAEHHSGARNHGHALWTLLTLEVFLRREGW